MNLWFIAFPCLMFLGSVGAYEALSSPCTEVTLNANVGNTGMGILTTYPIGGAAFNKTSSGISYFSISLSLNVILTLMIIVRLVLHGRNVRAAAGSPAIGISGLYKTIATILIESCAIFALDSLLVIGTLAPKKQVTNLFIPTLSMTQVRAFL